MVVKGTYPEQLLFAWDAFATERKSENERPSKFSETQTYCIIQLSHHGKDLEAHTVSTWSEAAHIFWSVARTLSRGESSCEFEHRDLHWGNILIEKSDENEILERLLDNLNLEDGGNELLDGGWGDVKITVIDYTLSRAKVNDLVGQIAHYGFEDESLFEGKRIASTKMGANLKETINSIFIGKCGLLFQMTMALHGLNIDQQPMSSGYIISPINCYTRNNFQHQ